MLPLGVAGEWARLHPGVYVDHTGAPTWDERAWGAVLACWPAEAAVGPMVDAASTAAFVSDDGTGDGRRRPRTPGDRSHGVILVRRTCFEERALLHLGPPRLRLEEALLDVASDARDPTAAMAVLAVACQEGRTTARRLASTLRGRGRLTHRRTLLMVLDDVAAGALSAFEHRYLVDVERHHGLPRAVRQSRLCHPRRGDLP